MKAHGNLNLETFEKERRKRKDRRNQEIILVNLAHPKME